MRQNQMLRIAVCGGHSPTNYSGGRYLSWMMAEALASLGHEVVVWTNAIPFFLDDFAEYPNHESIKIVCSKDFHERPKLPFDIVVLVPHGSNKSADLYSKVVWLASECQARLVLLNFETPNWFNKLAPVPRDPSLWDRWVEISQVADMILSLSAEGERYAREYYVDSFPETLFRYCHPAINSIIAEQVEYVEREPQVICITRFGRNNEHKGGQELLKAITPAMSGHTLAILNGIDDVDPDIVDMLAKKGERFGITIRWLSRLSDIEKFREIKRSRLMLFLSYFEGFGYPPVEAQYCDTPCIVYDLPVLREVSAQGLIYVPVGDAEALQESVRQVLSGAYYLDQPLSQQIAPVAGFGAYTNRLSKLISELMDVSFPPTVTRARLSSLQWRWYWMLDRAAQQTEDQLSVANQDRRQLGNVIREMKDQRQQLAAQNRELLEQRQQLAAQKQELLEQRQQLAAQNQELLDEKQYLVRELSDLMNDSKRLSKMEKDPLLRPLIKIRFRLVPKLTRSLSDTIVGPIRRKIRHFR